MANARPSPFRRLMAAAMVIACTGCMTVTYRVVTGVNSFRAADFTQPGGASIYVRAAGDETNSSLEFEFYREKLQQKFADQGFKIAADEDAADFLALASYGIDDGSEKLVSTPVFGQTGGGTSYSSGTVSGSGGSATYSGTSYTMPTYGVVGASTSSVTRFTRVIAIDMLDAQAGREGEIRKVYEMRARSTGSCSMMSAVFDEMLDAVFQDFPGENGRSETITITQGEDYSC